MEGQSVGELARNAAGDAFPAIVCFVNDAERPDGRTPEGKLTLVPIRDSVNVRATLLSPRIEEFSMAVKLFHVKTVDVAGVDPKDCPAVNKGKAPFIVILDVEGKVVKVMGPGIFNKAEILPHMRAALRPRLDLGKYLEKERKLVNALILHDSLTANLATKRKLLETAGTVNAGKAAGAHYAEEIRRLEAEEREAAAGIAAMETDIEKDLEKAGLKRI